jgi:hypothetical protein
MSSLLADARSLADRTPPDRNRVVDLWRAAAVIGVMLGHWLAASLWLRPDDTIALLNSLQWIPYAAWVTWIVQVMPVFFLVGGFANARGQRRIASGEQTTRAWVVVRARRLVRPMVPLLATWVVLVVVLRAFVPADVVYAGAMSATVPLWFLAVYLLLTAAAPATHAWWRRSGMWSVATLMGLSVAVDGLRAASGSTGLGYLNFLFVWGAVHQVGYWWADRDAGAGVPRRVAVAVSLVAFGVLVAITASGVYPVAMIGVPGIAVTNMTPPTSAILLLGLVQAGIVWTTQPAVARLATRPAVWAGVVVVSSRIMTLYLWHLSAMSLVAAIGLFTFGGVAFRIEPGTWAWWLTRPVWVAVLLAATLGLVAIFGRFESAVGAPEPTPRREAVAVGVLLSAGSAASVALVGITGPDAVIHWSMPVAAVIGAGLLGALPRWRADHRDDA